MKWLLASSLLTLNLYAESNHSKIKDMRAYLYCEMECLGDYDQHHVISGVYPSTNIFSEEKIIIEEALYPSTSNYYRGYVFQLSLEDYTNYENICIGYSRQLRNRMRETYKEPCKIFPRVKDNIGLLTSKLKVSED